MSQGGCRAGMCGSCGMVINGKPDLACRTLTSKFEDGQITLLPLPGFELIGDLSVNTDKFMQALSKRVESWIHDVNAGNVDFNKLEECMDPDIMDEVYELERCVECEDNCPKKLPLQAQIAFLRRRMAMVK